MKNTFGEKKMTKTDINPSEIFGNLTKRNGVISLCLGIKAPPLELPELRQQLVDKIDISELPDVKIDILSRGSFAVRTAADATGMYLISFAKNLNENGAEIATA